MNRSSLMVDSNEFLKIKNDSDTKKVHSGSLGDVSQSDLKHSGTTINREDSVINKSSLSSLFFKRTIDGPWSNGSVISMYIPRPDKTMLLFERIQTALTELHEKYSHLKTVDDGIEHQDYNEICTKIDDRMNLIKNLKVCYTKLLENKKVEFDRIQFNFRSILSNKNCKEFIDLGNNEEYWSICKELLIIESKLERCTGKLQFQIMDLDSISKINPMDQYELSIRLNESNKFKSRIKIEKNGHQLWDMRNFETCPVIDDFIHIKFTELKPLNKSSVLIERKLPFINDLIQSAPSIFTLWLTPVGTIKLKVIVQWNAVLDDSNLQSYFNNIDNKFVDHSSKSEVIIRNRASSTSHKYTNNKISTNIENMFRSSRSDNPLHPKSMSNIFEDNEDDKKSREIYNKLSNEIKPMEISLLKTDIIIEKEHNLNKNLENFPAIEINVVNETEIQTLENIEEKPKSVLLKQENVDISIQEDQLSNEDLEESITAKDESLENILSIKNTPPHLVNLENDGEIIESPIITINESIGNVENENEIIIDNSYSVEDSVSPPISRLINECLPEIVTNEIEVEINIDSSEVESVEQSIDDNINLNNESHSFDISFSSETSKHESYTIEDSEFKISDDFEMSSELTVPNILHNTSSLNVNNDSKGDDIIDN